MFVGDTSIHDRLFHKLLEMSYLRAGWNIELCHYLVAVNGIFPLPEGICILNLVHTFTKALEAFKLSAYFVGLLGSYVAFSENHEIFHILSGICDHTAYPGVAHTLISN